jgi:hypothetical protein
MGELTMDFNIETKAKSDEHGLDWIVAVTYKTGNDIIAVYERRYEKEHWDKGPAILDMMIFLQGELQTTLEGLEYA